MVLKCVVVFYVLACVCMVSAFGAADMVAKGTWSVLNIQRCENHEDYKYDVDVKRKRINRTHDAFDAFLNLDTAVEETHSLRVDICKFVEGGCKPYQKLADDSFCGFIKKFAENNVIDVLTQIGVDPPDCPIPPGKYELEDFLFNYEELPEDGLPGEYIATAFIIEGGEDAGCVSMTVKFEEEED